MLHYTRRCYSLLFARRKAIAYYARCSTIMRVRITRIIIVVPLLHTNNNYLADVFQINAPGQWRSRRRLRAHMSCTYSNGARLISVRSYFFIVIDLCAASCTQIRYTYLIYIYPGCFT
jgi:hypothetical protein